MRYDRFLPMCFVIIPILGVLPVAAESAPAKLTDQQREAYQKSIFVSFDKNKNGKLSRQEFVDVIIGNLFKDFDKNKNRRITKDEFFSYARDKKKAREEYPLMDSEGKGYITQKDVYRNKPLIQRLKKEFTKLDTKGKGFVTLSDLPDLTPGS